MLDLESPRDEQVLLPCAKSAVLELVMPRQSRARIFYFSGTLYLLTVRPKQGFERACLLRTRTCPYIERGGVNCTRLGSRCLRQPYGSLQQYPTVTVITRDILLLMFGG